MWWHRQRSKPFSFGSHPFRERATTRRAKPRGLFYLGRTDRVSNEPMFGVAIKKTGCAILIGRRSRLATGTCTNRAERLINGWATIQSPWKKNVAARANSILQDARRWLKINPSPYPIV
jgi:hypothetical protein